MLMKFDTLQNFIDALMRVVKIGKFKLSQELIRLLNLGSYEVLKATRSKVAKIYLDLKREQKKYMNKQTQNRAVENDYLKQIY